MKVLIVSHNCLSTYSNMGKTLLSLFGKLSKSELCQLYIYPSVTDVDVCGSYYRVTDKDILRSFLSFRGPGKEIDPAYLTFGNAVPYEDPQDAVVYGNKRNVTPFARIARDAMWKLSRWYTKDLQRWLDRENPTCIFLAPGYAKFIYDIALRIAKERGIPIVSYICDDYYFVKQPEGPVARMQLLLLKKKIEELMQKSTSLVVICEELKTAYGDFFDIPTEVIMTASGISTLALPRTECKPIYEISYFGNLKCNRYTALAEFAGALNALNKDRDTKYILNVYTPEIDQNILSLLERTSCVRIKGFVSGNLFVQAMAHSDYLLHAEAFDEASIDLVKNSISTKIAESLASGIPLIAYGPAEIASIQHLVRNDCALVITQPEDLRAVLTSAEDPEICKKVVEAACKTAHQLHSQEKNGEQIRRLLQSASDREQMQRRV